MSLGFGVPVYCADPKNLVKDVLDNVTYLPEGIDWAAQSHFICNNWFQMDGDWVIEGVGVVRALRKWINYYDSKPPCYNIIYIKNYHPAAGELLDGQESMTKSIESIWNEISHHYDSITEYKYWNELRMKDSINKKMAEKIEQRNTFKMFKV